MRRRLLASASALALCVGAVGAVALAGARAQDSSGSGGGELLSYTGHGAAPAVELVYDNNAFPVPSHPVFTGSLPLATADLEAGPSGSAFASVAWPGSLAGNLGTTVQQLNRLCSPPQLNLGCLPVTDQEKKLLAGANDPVRAAATSSGKNDASYGSPGALYMTAHTDAAGTVAFADAGVASLEGLPVLSLGSVASHADATTKGTEVTGEATSTTTGIVIGENLPVPNVPIPADTAILSIDSIVSVARATSNGADQILPSGGMTIGGVKVLGVPATIDDKGLHLGSQSTPLTAAQKALATVAQQALSALKFSVTVAPGPDVHKTGTQAVAGVGGVIIAFTDPSGSSWKLTLGRAEAMADATPSTGLDLGTSLPGVEGAVGGLETPGGVPAATGTSDFGSATSPLPSGTSAGEPAVLSSQGASATGSPPANGRANVGWYVLAGLVGAAIAFGMKRLSDAVLDAPAGSACPNEGRTE